MIFSLDHKVEQSVPVTRAASFSLLAVLVLVTLPLFHVLPFMVLGLVATAVIWRLLLLRTKGCEPGWIILTILVVLACLQIFNHYGTFLGLEAGAATLVSAYSLKLLEMRCRRDGLLVAFLGFFVVVTGLLFSQSIPMMLYLLVCLMVLVSVLVGIFQPRDKTGYKPVVKFGAIMAVQALPLTVILFLLVPRVPPLWVVPLPDNSAKVGLSDSMAPGEFAEVSKSSKLAFRATFHGAVPPPKERYWRAVVMYWFDGRRWSQGNSGDWSLVGVNTDQFVSWYPGNPRWAVPGGEPEFDYDVILEPSGQPFLPVLGPASEAIAGTGLTRDWRLLDREKVDLRKQYRVQSGLDEGYDRVLPDWLRAASLQLPKVGNPRTRKLARELKDVYRDDVSGLVFKILQMFQQEEFYYTLRPPKLDANSVDGFLFDTRRGFCAHYSGALVFLLRAAGIPARVIGGYQGGEVIEKGVLQVRQFDAHAWVEVWQPGYGWERVDPTAAVAPERVEEGLESAVAREGSFLEGAFLSPSRYRGVPLINGLRIHYEQLEYHWQRMVLSYDENAQKGLFQRWFGRKNVIPILIALLGASFVVVMVVFMLMAWKPWRRKLPPAERYYQRFCRRMARKGIKRERGEGPKAYVRRISREKPELSREAVYITSLYIRLAYGQARSEDLNKLKRCC
ncbi:DUF3488 and transglutaminase-like domain-containing protein [Sansalvadorimonas sp. 2012CJ34-2]|uniref:DUF3488 and transglutaminase-like domain-containing protein n=1 Tax=Parendozoicomonas callyspongiae TaxID=2942213 RepID=A0ABT0PBP4_9GAMM|nr:DUF3488 and transglutaminase-like domain-containing protein [Sansalvadorimonas sp. 2012CJ34-2]MCL6268703.1 DUF3488 and transglutaminase-like domain-containing protein [Sansalvadorimonas sp. 2012CJ34-2]